MFPCNTSYSEDFIDGTMINLFYNNVNKNWEIATRSAIGGNNRFYDDYDNISSNFGIQQYNISFKNLFYDTCKLINFNYYNLPQNYSYSFVIQHPFNRIVTPVSNPQLYLVKIVEIEDSDIELEYNIKNINLESFYNIYRQVFENSYISFPKRYNIDSYENIYNYFTNTECPLYCRYYYL